MAANAMVSPMSFLQNGWGGGRGSAQYLPMEPQGQPGDMPPGPPTGVLSNPGFNPSTFGSMGGGMGDQTGGMAGPPLGGGGPAPPTPTNDVPPGGMQGDRPGIPPVGNPGSPDAPQGQGPNVRTPFGPPGLEQGGFNPQGPGPDVRTPFGPPGLEQGGFNPQQGNPLLHPGGMNFGLQQMLQQPQFRQMMMQRMLGGLNPAMGGMGQNVAPPPAAAPVYPVGMNNPTAADRQAAAAKAQPGTAGAGFMRNPFGSTPGVM